MRSLKALFIIAFSVTSLVAAALPLAYLEGEHYKMTNERLAVAQQGSDEVVELFMYTCPHCYHLEPEVADWKQRSVDSETVRFVQVPAVFGAKQIPLATAFYAAEAMGILEKLHPLFFDAIHEDGLDITSQEAILDYVAEQDVDRASFEKMMGSFAVKSKVKKAALLTGKSGVTGVPSFVINGRYHTSIPMAGGTEMVFDIIDFLVEQSQP